MPHASTSVISVPVSAACRLPRVLALVSTMAVSTGLLSGCLTRQVWQPSYAPDAAHAVDVRDVGRYVPEQAVPNGAGGTAWRAAVTPFTVVADGGITFILFFADLAGLSYGAGDWMTRQTPKPGTTSPTAAQFGNLPSWFLGFVNIPLTDAAGHDLTFVAMPRDREVYVTGYLNQTKTLSVAPHEDQGQPILLSAYQAAIPSLGEASAVVSMSVRPVDGGLELSGSYRTPRDGAREDYPIPTAVFSPKKP